MKTHEPDSHIWLVVEPTHPEKYAQVKLGSSEPQVGMNIENVWNHQLVYEMFMNGCLN